MNLRHSATLRTVLIVLFVVLALFLSACGGRVSQVFSDVNSGLGSGAPQSTDASDMESSAAPAATSAPASAAEMPAAEPTAPMPVAGGADAAVGAAPPAESGAPPSDSTAPERPLGPEASLRAGEIDDNAAFDDYLAYLAEYSTNYRNDGVRPQDVAERYLIRVIDDEQRPVLDARVTIFDGERVVFRGRTYAGGRTIFIADQAEIANASELRAVAEYGNARAETTFVRNSTTSIELGLRGAQIDDTLRLDLLFLLDTTGSMDDELRKIQDTIDEISGRIDGFTPRPEIRYGLVAYKDQDDEYVTQAAPFTSDLATFRSDLRRLSALGGGDTPEAVDEALYDAVVRAEWNDQPAVRLVFLVADAGPHIRQNSQFTYLDGIRTAVERGVKIYPIAASNTDPAAEYVFRQMSQQTLGGFIFLTYQPGASGGAPGESTPLEAGEQPYTVEALDDLIVSIVERELAAAIGAR